MSANVNWPRWILASTSKHFQTAADVASLHMHIEGNEHLTSEYAKWIEFRIDGPNITELSKNYFRLDVEINILWVTKQGSQDFHDKARLTGIISAAMTDICIYCYGDGAGDDDSLLGILSLKQDNSNAIRIVDLGETDKDVKLVQGMVEGSYEMYLSI